MPGLLDFLNTDQGRMGLGLLAAAGPRTDGAGFGQRLQEGMGSFDAYKKQKRADQMQEMEMQAYMQKAEQQKALRELQKQFTTPAQSAIAGVPDRAAGNAMGNPNLFSNSSSNAVVPGVEGRAAKPAGFDRDGFGQAWEAMDPMAGGAYLSSIQKDNKPIALAEGASLVRPDGSTIFKGAPKAEALPSSVREFQYGQANPEYNSWSTAQKRAGATNVSVSNNTTQEKEQSKEWGAGLGKARLEINNAGFKAPSTLANVARMDALLQGVDGGKLAPLGADIASAASSFGITLDPKLGNKQAAEALAVEMALAQKPSGSGPMTDSDFVNFLNTVPGLSKSPEGRRQISATIKAKAQRDLEISKQARAYAKANGGVIDDAFFEGVAAYQAANPVVPQQQNGGLDAILNKYPPRR